MTLQYRNLNSTEYKDKRYLALLWLEEKGTAQLLPYSDNPKKGGYATIGAGFKIDSNWEEILKSFGFDYYAPTGSAEWGYIQKIKALVGTNRKFTGTINQKGTTMKKLYDDLKIIMTKRANDGTVSSAIPGMDKRTEFKFNDSNEVKSAFQLVADKRDGILTRWLGETTQYSVVPQSNERIALVSLVYNNIIGFKDNAQTIPKSPGLLAAIKADNRAAAWFEIRYNSNKKGTGFEKGLAKRRYYEADFFGLYDFGAKTPEEKILEDKTIMRMYTCNKDKIDQYEKSWGKQVTVAKNEYNVTWIKSLEENLQVARNALIASFSRGMSIDGEVMVGAGLSSYVYKEKTNINDSGKESLNGADKSDLIFGEKGDDVINGGAGNDVIYGGEGDDKITGGKDNDYLIGGIGNDTYCYNIGDGNDWIYDEDKKGRIVVKKKTGESSVELNQVVGSLYKPQDAGGANVWNNANGTIEITHNSPWTITLEDGGTITLGDNLQPGDFGINLIDGPIDPNPTNTIYGTSDNDHLYDTAFNDLIDGGQGDDTIEAISGGNNELSGGDGNDALGSYAANSKDLIKGGKGNDILYGGPDDDQIFGEYEGEMDNLITAGETAPSINEQGDLASGGTGNDFIYSSDTNDLLLGGEGLDLLTGSGGNDVILGDEVWVFPPYKTHENPMVNFSMF